MKNKRGELTSKQIITIVILIISFVIILAFFFMLNLKGEIDKEACRNSVALKGTFSEIPVVGGITKNLITLKCKTQDVCLSMDGNCDEEVAETINVEKKDELMKEMVNLLADCWWMMGEGRVNYGEEGDCAICYKVSFNLGDIEKVTYIELHEYMKAHQISDNSGDNYLNYLYGIGDISKISRQYEQRLSFIKDGEYAIVTKMEGKKNPFPPRFVSFSSKDLGGLGCSKFIIEV